MLSLKDIVTPKEYLISPTADKILYTQDRLYILKLLEHFERNHQQSFYNQKYSDSTFIIVDSIFYDETQNKLAVFVLEKYPPSREYSPKLYPTLFQSDFVYNAYCYLGRRENDSIDLRWLKKFSFMGNRTLKEAQAKLKHFYLVRFTTPEYPKPPTDEFNIDDKRFWTSGDWLTVFPN